MKLLPYIFISSLFAAISTSHHSQADTIIQEEDAPNIQTQSQQSSVVVIPIEKGSFGLLTSTAQPALDCPPLDLKTDENWEEILNCNEERGLQQQEYAFQALLKAQKALAEKKCEAFFEISGLSLQRLDMQAPDLSAHMSYNGLCKPPDMNKAIELWSGALNKEEHGHRWEAYARMSYLYEKAIGVPKDIELADEYADIAVMLIAAVKHRHSYLDLLNFSNPHFIDIGRPMWDRNMEQRMMDFIPDLTGPWAFGESLRKKQPKLKTLLEGHSEVFLATAIAEKGKADTAPLHLALAEIYLDLAADKGNADANFLRAKWLSHPPFRELRLRQNSVLFSGYTEERAASKDLYIDCAITESLEYAAAQGHIKAKEWLQRKLDAKKPSDEADRRRRQSAYDLLENWSANNSGKDQRAFYENGPLAYLHPSYLEYQGCF